MSCTAKYIPIIAILTLLLSCSAYRHNYQTEAEPVSWFKSDTGHFLFNTRIELLGNHYSGIMVIKPMMSGTYRMVLLTEVGLKVFDFELSPDGASKTHYIMDPMNRKILIKTLTGDLGLILMNQPVLNAAGIMNDKDSEDFVIKFHHNGKRNLYYFVPGSSKPYKAYQRGCLSHKSRVGYYGHETGIDSVILTHTNIRLNLNLYRIHDDVNE